MQSGMVLLFVYNIERGNLSGMPDYQQAVSSVKIPRCNLFALIYSPVGMKKAWKRFISELGFPCRYLYQDEFQQLSGEQKPSLPAVYLHSGKSFHVLISADEINRCGSVDTLIDLVAQKLKRNLT
jgi:hypothetical protein